MKKTRIGDLRFDIKAHDGALLLVKDPPLYGRLLWPHWRHMLKKRLCARNPGVSSVH